ncbi:MAG: hypothetical protein O3A53_21035 [Acidobacteria bacterium]|nr:hypothetical protein [Acidobacteriota bacterium]
MSHQAFEPVVGVKSVAVRILLVNAGNRLAGSIDVKHPIGLNRDPGTISHQIAQRIPTSRAGMLFI